MALDLKWLEDTIWCEDAAIYIVTKSDDNDMNNFAVTK